MKTENNILRASASDGEMIFVQSPCLIDDVQPIILSPIKYLLQSAKKLMQDIKVILKDKKKRMPALIMTLIWGLFMIINITLSANSSIFNVFNFLTFSNGGMNAGISGMVGGTIGRGIIAYFVSVSILPLLKGKKLFLSTKDGFKNLVKVVVVKNIKSQTSIFVGAGLALISYNFLTGNASIQNSMIGIVSFIMSIRILSSKNSFLRGFLVSFMNKYTKNKVSDSLSINRILAGCTLGFVIAVALSVTGISSICYIVGLLSIIVAIIIKIAVKNNKTEVAK